MYHNKGLLRVVFRKKEEEGSVVSHPQSTSRDTGQGYCLRGDAGPDTWPHLMLCLTNLKQKLRKLSCLYGFPLSAAHQT